MDHPDAGTIMACAPEAPLPPTCSPEAALPPTCSLVQRDTVRLIPSGRLKPAVLAPLAATPRALDDLAELEGATNGRIQACESGLPDLDPRELVFGRPNDSFVNAAFTHVRPGGNRFNDAGRGAWYCGWDAETSLGEVAYHLTRELDAIERYDTHVDYAALVADFIGPFHDLRRPAASRDRAYADVLAPEVGPAYARGQALARRLRAAGGNGLVYPSARWPGGVCLVAFRPSLVQNLRQGGLWRLTWSGGRTPAIASLS